MVVDRHCDPSDDLQGSRRTSQARVIFNLSQETVNEESMARDYVFRAAQNAEPFRELPAAQNPIDVCFSKCNAGGSQTRIGARRRLSADNTEIGSRDVSSVTTQGAAKSFTSRVGLRPPSNQPATLNSTN